MLFCNVNLLHCGKAEERIIITSGCVFVKAAGSMKRAPISFGASVVTCAGGNLCVGDTGKLVYIMGREYETDQSYNSYDAGVGQ